MALRVTLNTTTPLGDAYHWNDIPFGLLADGTPANVPSELSSVVLSALQGSGLLRMTIGVDCTRLNPHLIFWPTVCGKPWAKI